METAIDTSDCRIALTRIDRSRFRANQGQFHQSHGFIYSSCQQSGCKVLFFKHPLFGTRLAYP
jgi:hypothetical protein